MGAPVPRLEGWCAIEFQGGEIYAGKQSLCAPGSRSAMARQERCGTLVDARIGEDPVVRMSDETGHHTLRLL